ncbi:MAG: hypothetical protein ACXAC8_14035 [Candidatus Hodarchaeales archaeon]
MNGNPLKILEKEYTLLLLQYLHLNPNGRSFEQIFTSVEHNASPSKVNASLNSLLDLGLVKNVQRKGDYDTLFALTKRGRFASEVVWDLFRIILNPHDEEDDDSNLTDFFR